MSDLPPLGRATVAIQGFGRVGSTILLLLIAAGVRRFVINDPQRFEKENFNSLDSDESQIGMPKVHRFDKMLRSAIHCDRIVAPNENHKVSLAAMRADLLICASNTIPSRSASFGYAIRDGKPYLSVGVADARIARRGSIFLWLADNRDLACQACLLAASQRRRRGELLLYSVIGSTAAVAANLAVQILSGTLSEGIKASNLILLDLESYSMEALRILKRPDCPVCTEVSPTSKSGSLEKRS